ncbi:uncharacterized protein CEXT_788441 [Caerostris extrusa]|uniref:TIL domain-containing protein n=1 Tax=Caerostris extrusa TaxID=172846 RepID=A0AAV4WW97_CAEEX|nr:uncharacterized protein CEXT_788441 [Caerostris extrusa]
MCSSQCDKDCNNFDDDSKVCPSLVRMCKPGCTCEEGFVRGPKRECVRPFDCPNQRNFCPEGEVFSPSHAHCEADCVRGEDTKKACDKSLVVPGCTCKEGLVRAPDGRCIHNRKCPPTKICPPNEKFVNCSALCQKSCANLEVPHDCQKPCVGGCVCEEPFVRGKHGRCIRPKWCPPEEDNEDSEVTIIPPPYTDNPYHPESWTENPTGFRREDSDINDVSDTAGCPDDEECIFSCRDYGHRYGHCIGEKKPNLLLLCGIRLITKQNVR